MPTKKVARLSPRAQTLLDRFEQAARNAGWASEEASYIQEKNAERIATNAKRSLVRYITTLEVRA